MNQRSSGYRIVCGLALGVGCISIDPNSAPSDVLHDLDQIDSLAKVQRLHAPVNLILLELGGFVTTTFLGTRPARRRRLQVDRSCHDSIWPINEFGVSENECHQHTFDI